MANLPSRRRRLHQVAARDAQNAGLWFERMLPEIPKRQQQRGGEGEERPPQAAHVAQTAAVPVPEPLYAQAYERWHNDLKQRAAMLEGASSAAGETPYCLELREATVIGRMAVGLGADGVLETAISLQRSYGVPQIPGSALKGATSSYAHRYLDEGWHKEQPAHIDLFGNTTRAGLVTFYDALYIPRSSRRPLEPDTITVHHPDYYQGSGDSLKAPADWDSPTPISFLSAVGSYLIALEGPTIWVKAAYEILELALSEIGVGAKTSSGYGRLRFGSARRETVPPVTMQSTTLPKLKTEAPQPGESVQKQAGPTLPEIGDIVSGSLAGFLDDRRREVKVRLNRVPPYVVGVIAAKLISGRTSGGLKARVVRRMDERGTTYLYLEPVKA